MAVAVDIDYRLGPRLSKPTLLETLSEDEAEVTASEAEVEAEVTASEAEGYATKSAHGEPRTEAKVGAGQWVPVQLDDGRTYYHNELTDETTWERPEVCNLVQLIHLKYAW